MATIAQVLDAFLGVDQTGRGLPQATRSGNFAAKVHLTHLAGLWLAGRLIAVRFERYVVACRDWSSTARIADLQSRITDLRTRTPHQFAFMRTYVRVDELIAPTQVIALLVEFATPDTDYEEEDSEELAR